MNFLTLSTAHNIKIKLNFPLLVLLLLYEFAVSVCEAKMKILCFACFYFSDRLLNTRVDIKNFN